MEIRAGARVHHGFDEAAQAVFTRLRTSRDVAFLSPAHHFDEFLPGLLGDFRSQAARGGRMRLVIFGPLDTALAGEAVASGLEVRHLAETREVCIVATDTAVFLFPPELRPESPLTLAVVELTDPVAVVHFRLALERAWAAGTRVAPASPGAAPRGAAFP